MAKVELDVASDIPLGDFLDMCEEYNLNFKIIDPHGPAGGNPLVEFTGDDNDVKRFMSENEYENEDDY